MVLYFASLLERNTRKNRFEKKDLSEQVFFMW